jgi:ceramide glucosyltransferase
MTAALVFLALLFVATAAYVAAAIVLAWCRRADCALPPRDFTPPISIVKPLAGGDDGLEANLESFFRLDYPAYEVVFSFARRDDPAFGVALRVADRHPHVRSVFVVDRRDPLPNPKVNRLAAGVRRARHGYVLFSDGNVRVRPDFLRCAIAPFRDPSVGLVSNLFRGSWPRTLASRLECLYLNGLLLPGTAMLARLLSQPCVVGKSILVSRVALDTIGGLEEVGNYLAEDFLLGVVVRRAGFRVVLSADTLETAEITKSAGAAWARHRRWSMMRSRLGGPAYLSELLSNPLPWFAGVLACSGGRPGIAIAAGSLLFLRYLAEILSERDGGHRFAAKDVLLLPVRDLLCVGLFWSGLLGRRTSWRGRSVIVGPRSLIVAEPVPGGGDALRPVAVR